MGPLAIPHGETYADPPTEVMVTGRVTSIVVDPTDYNIIYVGTALGGVWKTTNGGKEWAPQSDYEISSAIGALVLDPSNHNVVYAGTGEGNNILHERYDRFNDKSYYGYGVLKSVNGGQSWTLYGEAIFGGARFSPRYSSIQTKSNFRSHFHWSVSKYGRRHNLDENDWKSPCCNG